MKKGQVVRSQDLTSAGMLLAAVVTLWLFGAPAAEQLASALVDSLSTPRLEALETNDAANWMLAYASRLAFAAVPLLVAMLVAGVLVNLVQTGMVFSTKKVVPKLSHISPISGVKRIASLQGVMRLGFGLFKVAVIAVVAFFAIQYYSPSILGMSEQTVPQVASTMFDCLLGTCVWIGVALFILAILEYAFQKWKHEQDLMMTDQEVRDELKETEGDPQVAARRRMVQRQLMMQRAENEVPNADVVVSNPTELAIAIQYDPLTMPAPVVVAKGAGVMAQKIRRLALEHGIPVVERKPLAQVLYKTVDVGDVIPADHYQAVAEVLRYGISFRAKKFPRRRLDP